MKPYYEHAGITIYHGDCREVMPGLEPVDLVLTDPPYNAGMDYGPTQDDRQEWSTYAIWMKECITVMETVSKGLVLVFASVRGMLEISSVYQPKWVCVWEKPMAFSHRVGGSPWLPHWEPCLVYGRMHGDEGRVPDFSMSDVWSSNTATNNGHPCPKPTNLMRLVLKSIPLEVVLDPFMGSGTTLRAAKDLGRKAIGIEIEERYCELAANRMAQEVLPFGETVDQSKLEDARKVTK